MHRTVRVIVGVVLVSALGLGAVAAGPPGTSQAPAVTAKTVLAPEDLLADAKVARAALEALHPGLYRYQTRAEFDARWGAYERALSRPLSLGEAYWELSAVLATIRCGHTYANFWNQSKAVKASLLEAPARLPVHFRWIDGRMIVTRNRSTEAALAPGAEIVSVNGHAAADILAKLMRVARADGASDVKRVQYLGVSGDAKYEAFDVFFPIAFPFEGDVFTLTVRGPGEEGAGAATEVRVRGLAYQQRLETHVQAMKRRESGEPVWSMANLDERTAVLTMPTWAVYDSTWDWRGWVQARMDELVRAGTPNLVIDLRGNEGGLDCGNEVIARLIERDVEFGRGFARYVRAVKSPAELNRVLDTWDDSFRDWGASAKPAQTPRLVREAGETYFRLVRAGEERSGVTIAARGPRYAGRVFVLVDSACSSATFQFASMMKRERLGTVVGQTTGGNRRGINGGAFFFVRLERTGLEFDLPLIATFPEDGSEATPDAGVEPDVVVPVRAADIAAGVDAEMEAVRRMIGERK